MARIFAASGARLGVLFVLCSVILVGVGVEIGEARAQKEKAPPIVCKKVPFPKYNDDTHYGDMNAALLAEHERGYRLVQLLPWIYASSKPTTALACFTREGS